MGSGQAGGNLPGERRHSPRAQAAAPPHAIRLCRSPGAEGGGRIWWERGGGGATLTQRACRGPTYPLEAIRRRSSRRRRRVHTSHRRVHTCRLQQRPRQPPQLQQLLQGHRQGGAACTPWETGGTGERRRCGPGTSIGGGGGGGGRGKQSCCHLSGGGSCCCLLG